jgi:hypothetical protein
VHSRGECVSDRKAASPFLKKIGRALRLLVMLRSMCTVGMVVKGVPRSKKYLLPIHSSRTSFQLPCEPSG